MCALTEEGTVLTQLDVTHDEITNVEGHHEDQDEQDDTQVQFPVKVTGAEIDTKGSQQGASDSHSFSIPKVSCSWSLC